jgi:hypothetical protein
MLVVRRMAGQVDGYDLRWIRNTTPRISYRAHESRVEWDSHKERRFRDCLLGESAGISPDEESCFAVILHSRSNCKVTYKEFMVLVRPCEL